MMDLLKISAYNFAIKRTHQRLFLEKDLPVEVLKVLVYSQVNLLGEGLFSLEV